MGLLPEDIPIPDEQSVVYDPNLVSDSTLAVGRLDGSIKDYVSDQNLILSLFFRKEAETSTRIEGTHVTFEGVMLESEDGDAHEERSARLEALGVVDAIHEGLEALERENIPISNRVIKRMHGALMKKAQLEYGPPGEFRKLQVKVGSHIPPEPQYVPSLMSDLEKYIHDEPNVPPIVKIAIVHAQFEIIHPFSDGNGRVGRLLIPFLMKQYRLTRDASFFISQYFESSKRDYYDSLESITKKDDWNGWIDFFLQSVKEHGIETEKKVDELTGLYRDGEFLSFKSALSQHIKNHVFRNPIFTVPSMVRTLEGSGVAISNRNDLHRILTNCTDVKVLVQGKGKRQTRYTCPKIVQVINNIYS
ncbi:MAG: Fic family protein [Candidatus Kaiserbacteria bacterium]|nr:Fic family protein [Candidatus Kaiserbacteria bacterium]